MNIEKLPSGNWRTRVYYYDAKGNRHAKSISARTRREVQLLAAEYRFEKDASDDLLRECYYQYIDAKSEVLSPSTVREYRNAAQRDFLELMGKRIDKLTVPEIQSAVNSMAATRSPKSVKNAWGLLHAVLKMYRPEFSPSITLPQSEKNEIYIPTDEEVLTLVKYFENRAEYIAILLGAYGPMRRSEICAITFGDVKNGIATVNKAMVRSADREWVIKQPKTINGYRTIYIPEFVNDAIEAIRGADDARIVPLSPSTLTHEFEDAVKKTGVTPMHFHSLRHYCASYMHAMGIPDEYICARGGWDVMSLQRIYRHAMQDKRNDFETKINESFSKLRHD